MSYLKRSELKMALRFNGSRSPLTLMDAMEYVIKL